MAKILVVDDDAAFREGLIETLTDLGFLATGAANGKAAAKMVQTEKFDLIFIDFKMPHLGGIETMKLIQAENAGRTPPIIMLTAYSDSQNTIEAMRLGAFDHLTKPVGKADIQRVVEAVLKAHPPEESIIRKRDEIVVHASPQLVGSSEALREILKLIGRLAASDTTVLILGETGTGKEVVAQTIHRSSARSKAPFVAVNCASIPESLLESELFGHVRGAFTGATGDKKGSFQVSSGGTLFLDEIGDMNLLLQAKILRAVQEKQVVPVGASKPIPIDCRIIAATHQNLREMVNRHEFREDLYYRLNVVQIQLPALRERITDLKELSRQFLNDAGAAEMSLSEDAFAKLLAYPWPGNVRELKNTIERAVVLAAGRIIGEDDIRLIDAQAEAKNGEAAAGDWHGSIAALEKKLLTEALRSANGNRSEAARSLGIQRQLLYSKIKEHGLDPGA